MNEPMSSTCHALLWNVLRDHPELDWLWRWLDNTDGDIVRSELMRMTLNALTMRRVTVPLPPGAEFPPARIDHTDPPSEPAPEEDDEDTEEYDLGEPIAATPYLEEIILTGAN